MDDLRECYRVLDLEPGASLEEIKQSYCELIKVWHPERFKGNPKLQAKADEQMKRISLAYEWLCKEVPPFGAAASETESEPQPPPSPPRAKPQANQPRPENPQAHRTPPAKGSFRNRFASLPLWRWVNVNKVLTTVLAGLFLLVLSWLFPPWRYEFIDGRYLVSVHSGFHSIFGEFPKTLKGGDYVSYRVDTGRLVLLDLCIVAVSVGVFIVFKYSKATKP